MEQRRFQKCCTAAGSALLESTLWCRSVDLPRPSAIFSAVARVLRARLSSGSNPWMERSHLPNNTGFTAAPLENGCREDSTHLTWSGLSLGPDTSDTEVDVQLRHVISCAGLSKAAVPGILEQRPLSEPAAHKEPRLAQRLAVLHYGPVENVPVYQPVNGDITGTWGTEPDFISHRTRRAPARGWGGGGVALRAVERSCSALHIC